MNAALLDLDGRDELYFIERMGSVLYCLLSHKYRLF